MSRRGFELKKCVSRWGIDRISELPDDIITHILSFLPLKDAVATSILSPRWVNLWKYIPNLIFIDASFKPIPPIGNGMTFVRPIPWDVHSLKNAECVNSFVNSYKALSVKQLTISFTIHPNAHHHVSKWLRFAFSKEVENLKLDFVCDFVLYYLDTNTLRSSGIHISDYKFLKELTLAHFHVSGRAIEFLLRNCSLERLIMNVSLTSDLFIYTTLLKYLEIHCYSGRFIKVFAPNLTQLSCNYNHEMFLLEDVPNLVDASFGLAEPKATMRQFANAAAKLEILSIAVYRVQEFFAPQMPKLKKLVIDYFLTDDSGYLLPVTCLLQTSPYLEEFKLEILDYERCLLYDFFPKPKAILEVPKHENIRHNGLKVFEFAGFCERARDHVELVMYIVNNCVALEEIIIIPICYAVACEFQVKLGTPNLFLTKFDAIAEERRALAIKKSTEQLLLGIIPHHIKLIIK